MYFKKGDRKLFIFLNHDPLTAAENYHGKHPYPLVNRQILHKKAGN